MDGANSQGEREPERSPICDLLWSSFRSRRAGEESASGFSLKPLACRPVPACRGRPAVAAALGLTFLSRRGRFCPAVDGLWPLFLFLNQRLSVLICG